MCFFGFDTCHLGPDYSSLQEAVPCLVGCLKTKPLWPVGPFLPPLPPVVTNKNVSGHFQMSPVGGGGEGTKISL